ncbi:MAG: HD-GYP domain-containing protein [Sterolibacteriaceae bacterium]|nr:HD-GYP domain-containing protein [Sterolibacteriaceae bacterium]MBK9084477.1 HD-GYP domain-containing protein [Sterolibacteriaceae bacterium]
MNSPWQFLPDLFGRRSPNGGSTPAGDNDLLASLLVMAWFVEARDAYTGGHLWRVSRFSELLAEAAGRDQAQVARTAIGGFLHDLGKIGVPDAILNKRDRLANSEFAVIRTHPEIGARLLSGHPLAGIARAAALLHHERPDGSGYPRGLGAGEIPDEARIVGISDAFDAMTSARPYRTRMPIRRALDLIEAERGTQFDGALAESFIGLGRAGVLDHVVGHSDDGIPLHECLMCGPTLVRQRESRPGEHLYCRSCGGEYELGSGPDGAMQAVATGRAGTPQQLEPAADSALIGRLVQEVAQRIPLSQLLGTVAQ